MLTQPTDAMLIALEQASKLPRWKDVDKLIEAELTATLDRIIGAQVDAELHALRGRAKFLREFQQLVRDAPAQLTKRGVKSPLA